jgi:hypothetical protein
MNTYTTTVVVDQYLETLRAEAAARRSTRVGGPSLVQRVATRLAILKAVLTVPMEPVPGLPTLTDYPYRS